MSASHTPVPEFDRPMYPTAHSWFRDYVNRHFSWSFRTLGPGANTESICRHIEKEVQEIRTKPEDLEEWIDIIILGLDGALRCQGVGNVVADDIRDALETKLAKNMRRSWIIPEDPTQPIEHDRTKED